MESKDHRAVDVTVSAGPAAPASVRSAVARWLSGRVDDAVLHEAVLLASELVTNSTRHAITPSGAAIRVRGSLDERVVRIDVLDRGQHGAVAARDPGDDGGYGLLLVESLAADWGVRRGLGTEVWFELATAPTNGVPAHA